MPLPDPLTPADCDLRDFQFMPLDIARLFGSEFHARASDGEWRAGLTLWLKSYHQVPAASLPDDEVALARLAEYGRDLKSWRAVKDGALHGWVKCSDGRLYHPVVAEKVLEGWLQKLHARLRGGKGNAKRWKLPFDAKALEDKVSEASRLLRDLNPSSSVDQPLMPEASKDECPSNPSSIHEGSNEHSTEDRKGQGQGQGEEKEPPLPPEGDAAGAAGDQDESPPKPVRKKRDAAFDPLTAKPDNVNADTWASWVQHRREIRKPLTPTSCSQQAAQLATHPNPDAVIATSIASGWQGLFPDRVARTTAAKPSNFTNLPKHTPDMYQEEPDHDGPNF